MKTSRPEADLYTTQNELHSATLVITRITIKQVELFIFLFYHEYFGDNEDILQN